MRNVALCYVRRSELDAEHRESIERQTANCANEAARNQWVPEFFAEPEGHRSGRTEKHRPAWALTKAQLDRPDVAALIVESLSRACRSVKDLANLVELLDERGVVFVSVKERIETRTAAGRLFLHMLAAIAQFESDIAAERMSMSIEFRRKQKGRHWGRTPFGCARDAEHQLIPTTQGVWSAKGQIVVGNQNVMPFVDGAAAEWRGHYEALQTCYEWYSRGDVSIAKLVAWLNNAGFRFRDRLGFPRPFNDQDIRRLLDMNRIYAGHVIRGAAKKRTGESWQGGHKPILQVELCDKVQETIKTRHVLGEKINRRRGKDRVYALTPLLYCAACGRKMSGHFQDEKQWYRHEDAKQCGAKGQVVAKLIETQVLEYLAVFKMPDELKERIQYLARQMAKAQANPTADRARSNAERLARQLENLKELRIEGEIDKMEYNRRKQTISAQLREAQREIPQAPTNLKSIESLLSKIDQIAEVILNGSVEKRKELYATLFARIEQSESVVTAIVPHEWVQPLFLDQTQRAHE